MGGQKAGDVLVYFNADFLYHNEFELAVLTAKELKEIKYKLKKLIEADGEVHIPTFGPTFGDNLEIPWDEITLEVIKKGRVVDAFKTLEKENLPLWPKDNI